MYAISTALKNRYPRLYRRCTFVNLTLLLLLLSLLWNEYVSYMAISWKWSHLKSKRSGQSGSADQNLRVMFVADPQLIGLNDEPSWIGFLTRWDADRYLRRTFRRAYSHIDPEVIIFLGDLLDEGSHASVGEYDSYVERFHSIFGVHTDVKMVYIAGDNDIGGEGFDPRLDSKVSAFHQHFMPGEYPPRDVINAKFIDFFRLTLQRREAVMGKLKNELSALYEQSVAKYRVLCNHESIIVRPSNDQNNIISATKANMIFTAHLHKSVMYTCTDCREYTPHRRRHSLFEGITTPMEDHRIYSLDMTADNVIYEIMVPTCSYRMGVPKMGYASAVFDVSGRVQYTVLWQPSRYDQLKMHGVSVVLAVSVLIGWKLLGVFGVR